VGDSERSAWEDGIAGAHIFARRPRGRNRCYDHVNNAVYMGLVRPRRLGALRGARSAIERCLELDRGMAYCAAWIAYMRPRAGDRFGSRPGSAVGVNYAFVDASGAARIGSRDACPRRDEYAVHRIVERRRTRWPRSFASVMSRSTKVVRPAESRAGVTRDDSRCDFRKSGLEAPRFGLPSFFCARISFRSRSAVLEHGAARRRRVERASCAHQR